MKFTFRKGLFRLVMAAAVILVSLPIAETFAFGAICVLFSMGWLICWLIGGFFEIG